MLLGVRDLALGSVVIMVNRVRLLALVVGGGSLGGCSGDVVLLRGLCVVCMGKVLAY